MYYRMASAPPLPKRLGISWVADNTMAHERDVLLASVLESATRSGVNAMRIEILADEHVDVYMVAFPNSQLSYKPATIERDLYSRTRRYHGGHSSKPPHSRGFLPLQQHLLSRPMQSRSACPAPSMTGRKNTRAASNVYPVLPRQRHSQGRQDNPHGSQPGAAILSILMTCHN